MNLHEFMCSYEAKNNKTNLTNQFKEIFNAS
jgi:hypothetical protein